MSIAKMKNEVKELRERLSPKHSVIRVLFHFHTEGEPHGFLGSQWLILEKGKEPIYEAASSQEELDFFSREHYEKIDSEHVSSYEKWIECRRCKCGHHGKDGKQPFFGKP